MIADYLLDTHIVSWWMSSPKRLSGDQLRAMGKAVARGERLAYSGVTLVELAVAYGVGNRKGPAVADKLLRDLENDPAFAVLPITFEIAMEVATMGAHLQDPNDRAIVATARVHRLTLITSDERIIKSKLVNVIG